MNQDLSSHSESNNQTDSDKGKKTSESNRDEPTKNTIENWKKTHSWLIIENGAMYCQLCINANLKNIFTGS